MPTTTIDIHPHVISDRYRALSDAPVGGQKSDWSRDRPVQRRADDRGDGQAGIAKSALVQASTCYGHDNSYVADAVAAHPGPLHRRFFRGCAGAGRTGKDSLLGSGGKLTGMRLFTAGSTMPNQADWVDDPRSFPAWDMRGRARTSRVHADDR